MNSNKAYQQFLQLKEMLVDALTRENAQDINYCVTTFSNPDNPLWKTRAEKEATFMFQGWYGTIMEKAGEFKESLQCP